MACKAICRKLQTPMMLLSVPIGAVVGGIFIAANSDPPYSKRNIMYVGFLGELGLLAIKSISLPLIVMGIVSGISSLNASLPITVGWKYFLYVIVTKLVCVVLGLVIALTLVPKTPWLSKNSIDGIVVIDQYEDWFRLFLPENVIAMFMRTETTYYEEYDWGVVLRRIVRGTNYGGLVLISIVSGVVLRILASKSEEMLDIIRSLIRVNLEIMSWVVGVLPICMVFDVASGLMELDLSEVNPNFYIMYLTATAVGLLSLLIIIYPLIYLATVRKNPFRLMINFGKAMATSFAASSTIAALQHSVECMEKKNNIDKLFTRSLIPIGHTIHLSGKTFQSVVLAVFVANATNVYLNEVDCATILFLGFLVSFVEGPLPVKHKLSSMMLLNGIGMQHGSLSAILMLDWIVGRLTAVVDVAGNCVGVAIIAHLHEGVDNDVPAAT